MGFHNGGWYPQSVFTSGWNLIPRDTFNCARWGFRPPVAAVIRPGL